MRDLRLTLHLFWDFFGLPIISYIFFLYEKTFDRGMHIHNYLALLLCIERQKRYTQWIMKIALFHFACKLFKLNLNKLASVPSWLHLLSFEDMRWYMEISVCTPKLCSSVRPLKGIRRSIIWQPSRLYRCSTSGQDIICTFLNISPNAFLKQQNQNSDCKLPS